MKKIMSLLVLLVIFVSCKEEKKQDTTTKPVVEKPEERDINDFLVFENLLLEQNIEGAEYTNVEFTDLGALFAANAKTPSYIKLPNFNLDLNKEFNISFSYSSNTDDGTKPQTFIAFADKYSSPIKSIPLFIYMAGKRITGVYGDQKLWAEKYNKDLGESKAYYDSYQLSSNEVYFVSVNFTGTSIDIYVNSEIYASFANINSHSASFEKIVLGGLPQGDSFTTLMNGTLHGLKVFNVALAEKEIVELYNNQPYLGSSN